MSGKTLLSRVLLVVAIALLPGLALQIYTERQDRGTRKHLMEDQVLRSLRLVTDATQRIVDGSALVLDAIGAAPGVQDRDPAACRRLMGNIVATAPRYVFAAFLAPDGHSLCGSGAIDPGIAARDRPYFRRALQTGAFAVGDYAVGRGSGKPSLHFARPVRGADGSISGVIMISLSLKWLQSQLDDLRLPDEIAAAIMDRDGIVLAHSAADDGAIGDPVRAEKRFVLRGGEARIARATDRFGRGEVLAYEPPGAGPSGLAVVVGVDAATAYASITAGSAVRLWLIVTSSIAALLLTVVFGRRLINRPVGRLLETAERWRAGDLSARSELAQDMSEFGRLATAFDSLAATLQAREHALNMALESTQDAVVVFDRDWRYVYTNAKARAMNGVDRLGRVIWEDTPEVIGTPTALALLEAVRTGKPTQADGYVLTQKRYLQINAYPSADGLTVFFRDLTEERRTAAALRDSEARLQLAREAAGFGIWERDYTTGKGSWSDEQWRLFGRAPGEQAPDDMIFRAFIHPADLAQLSADRHRFRMGSADRFTTEYRVVWPDGSVHWLNDRVKMLRAPDGTAQRAVGVTFDVTERREAEEQLRQVTAELREAHRIARLGNWQYDVGQRVSVVSDEVRRILGLDPEGPVPTRFDQRGTVYPEHAWETINAAIERAIATGEGFNLDVQAQRGSEPIWLNSRGEAIRGPGGTITGLRGTLQDITDRKRIERALRDSELRLRISQEAGRIGSWDWNLQTDELLWSELQQRQFGVARAEGNKVTLQDWRTAVHPEDLAAAEAKLQEAIAGGDFLEMDYRIVTQVGLRWMHARAHVVRNSDGRAMRMIGIDMDITERRELEDALRTLTRTLELRIEQEVAAREAAQARAAQAERIQALGQLAGGIAHDFNNVLQATMGAFSLIERRPNDHDGIRRIARMAGEACERGASITRRLLSFARRGDLRAGRVDIGELLAGLQEILNHTLGAGIDVRVEIEGNLGPALVDRSQLETVLVNLATNARDAMPGGGRLVFSATLESVGEEAVADGSPHPSGLAPGAYVRLAVADTGQGMDAATLARAGEPFFTTKGHGEGTGLGLSMAKGFVEQSGGAFSITSTLGLGTTITLWLPEAAPGHLTQAPARGRAAEADPFTGAPRKRVLLVDDQDSVRKILAAQLRDAGFDVVPAAGGEQAIALLAGGLQVDALVSDLSMPQVDGLAVISAAQQHLPRLPAILLTGYAGDDAALAVSGAISGSFSLLRKPVEDAHLVDRLSTLLAACEV